MAGYDAKDAYEAHRLCVEAHNKVKVGGTLYINKKWITFRDQPGQIGQVLGGAVLGEEVIWLGASEANREFHKIRFTVKRITRIYNPPIGTIIEGYTHGSNLSVCKPLMEAYSKDPMEKISSEAFSSNGLAIRG